MFFKKHEQRKPPIHLTASLIMLSLFAVVKIFTVLAQWSGLIPYSNTLNPVITFLIGVVEMVIVFLCYYYFSVKRASQFIVLIGSAFLIYRFVINPRYCPCMGALPEYIPWLKLKAELVLITIPCWWVCLGLWGWAWEQQHSS